MGIFCGTPILLNLSKTRPHLFIQNLLASAWSPISTWQNARFRGQANVKRRRPGSRPTICGIWRKILLLIRFVLKLLAMFHANNSLPPPRPLLRPLVAESRNRPVFDWSLFSSFWISVLIRVALFTRVLDLLSFCFSFSCTFVVFAFLWISLSFLPSLLRDF